MERPTIYSLAEQLRISPSTVSRAFSDPGKVRRELREQILLAAEKAGYYPHNAARALSTGRSGLVGVLMPDVTNPFFPQLLSGLIKAARRREAELLFIDSAEASQSETRLVARVQGQVDAFIFASPRSPVEDLVSAIGNKPVTCINRIVEGVSSTYVDDDDAILGAVAHLRMLGHERVALVGGPSNSWTAQRRAAAALSAASSLGIELVHLGSFPASFDGGLQSAPAVVRSRATAVLAFDDVSAFGVVSGLAAMGLHVPGDVSVVGCDDVPFASMMTPQLTTITAPVRQVAEAAVDLLYRLIQHGVAEAGTVIPFRSAFVVRGTTSARPA
ncbi:LacI family DNA-binding transcriptional regulator [Tessaracoccus lubricantis]|uniref:LacI family DNA-binding transcriptional regulator n=1 Tax=Tessaracoccus lubricantis TaxID=545543 RepID=A0ABP9FHV0_9ACTN